MLGCHALEHTYDDVEVHAPTILKQNKNDDKNARAGNVTEGMRDQQKRGVKEKARSKEKSQNEEMDREGVSK